MYRTWLRDCGVDCDDSRNVEIGPLVALDAGELKNKLNQNPELADADLIDMR